MDGWELRERRHAAGLTLEAVARAAGTSASNVSAYERSAKRPNERTMARLVAVIDAGASSPIHRAQLLTVPATAALIRRGLGEGWSTAELLRVVRQMLTDAESATSPLDRAAFCAAPSTTGDRRWDLLLAGAVEDFALRSGTDAPEWVQRGSLDTFWFVNSSRVLDAYTFARSPISMQVRGVMIDPADLAAV